MYDAVLPTLPRSPWPRISWGAGASAGLHVALALAAIWLSPIKHLAIPAPQAVTVEIVTQEQFDALEAPAATSARTESPFSPVPLAGTVPLPSTPSTPVAPPQAEQSGSRTHRATAFYSTDLLKEPGMAGIRRTLTQLADYERMVQLCNIEGLEQIRRTEPSYAPDALVAYAMSEPVSSGFLLIAKGAAFRSRRKWYGVSVNCAVASDYQGVTAFSYTIGDAIPEAKWDGYSLNAEDADE